VNHNRRSLDEGFLCRFCPKWFEREIEFKGHIGDHSNLLSCNYCEDKFDTKNSLMKHNKQKHSERLSTCWNFSTGHCHLGDENCWFLHKDKDKSADVVQYECNLCNEVFQGKSQFMKHRKSKHNSDIEKCSYASGGVCKFGADKCWYSHNNNENYAYQDKSNNQEIFDKLFQMMEKMTDRILYIENKN
jgi:hypothetical protein